MNPMSEVQSCEKTDQKVTIPFGDCTGRHSNHNGSPLAEAFERNIRGAVQRKAAGTMKRSKAAG